MRRRQDLYPLWFATGGAHQRFAAELGFWHGQRPRREIRDTLDNGPTRRRVGILWWLSWISRSLYLAVGIVMGRRVNNGVTIRSSRSLLL